MENWSMDKEFMLYVIIIATMLISCMLWIIR